MLVYSVDNILLVIFFQFYPNNDMIKLKYDQITNYLYNYDNIYATIAVNTISIK